MACHSLCIGYGMLERVDIIIMVREPEPHVVLYLCTERLGQTHLMWLSLTIMEAEVSFAYALEAAPLRAARATKGDKTGSTKYQVDDVKA